VNEPGSPGGGANGDPLSPGWVGIARKYGVEALEREHRPQKGLGAVFGTFGTEVGNIWASFLIAMQCVITLESMMGCALAISYTLAYWYWAPHTAVNMSWNIVSLAVVFPISQGIGMGFKRREQALSQFSMLLGNMRQVWGAVHCWKVKKPAGHPSPDDLVRVIELYDDIDGAKVKLRQLFEQFLAMTVSYFDVPRSGRARHAFSWGEDEAERLSMIMHEHRLSVVYTIQRMQRLIQDLKIHGLPGGEAHRLDQYISKMSIAFEMLSYLKEYRTPQAFRAFARMYILLVGALYGPYYVYVGKGQDAEKDELGVAIAFACGVQLSLGGLFTVMLGLEDPFARRGYSGMGRLDRIRVPEIVELTRQQLVQMERMSQLPWSH